MAKGRKSEPKVNIGEVVVKTEDFMEKYQKPIVIGLSVVVLLVLIFFGFKKFYKEPLEEEAREQMFMAEHYFLIDSFKVALNGVEGGDYGFLKIIDEYGSTRSGNLAHYYAGICQRELGSYEEAITHLKKYNGKDEIVGGKALCAIGDAYVQLGKYDDAATYFMKAADYRDNLYAAEYLAKAALVYEELGKFADMLKAYERIKTDYPNSPAAQVVDKEIVRARILSERK